MKKTIRLLLPKGSLNTPGRGDTCGILKQAGYEIEGYEPGKESDRNLRIVNDPEIEAMLSRPQSMPLELSFGSVESSYGSADIAIVGSDWVVEETNGNGLVQIADLGYGKTRLVFAVDQNEKAENLDAFVGERLFVANRITCFTEYVNTAARAIAATYSYRQQFGRIEPLKRLRGVTSGENEKVKVIMSDGVTEGFIRKGAAKIIMDNTQSGSTLREYGLRELEQVAESSAGLYANQKVIEDSWLRQKAEEVARQILGVVEARKKVYVVFNVENKNLAAMLGYLQREQLYSDEPTLIRGQGYTQVSILVPKQKWPSTSRDLVSYGAKSIVRTEPLQVMG